MANNNKRTKERKTKKGITGALIVVIVVLCAAIIGVVVAMAMNNDNVKAPESDYVPPTTDEFGSRITYNGQQYRWNDNIKTVLFLGVDQESDHQWDDYLNPQEGVVGNAGRADTIILFILDKESQTTKKLMISRDTMTEVDVYDMKGNFVDSIVQQLTMQYAYGDSPSKSLFLTKRAVGKLLYNTHIDGSISLTLDGIRAIVDMLGGIELTMPKDYTYIDERFEEGTTWLLNGEYMEQFIRYRDTDTTGSNEERMNRQSWLISAVFTELKNRGETEMLQEIIDSNPEYIESNCQADLIKKLSQYQILDETLKVPGTVVQGEIHDEFYVDEMPLREMIIDLLYVPVEEEESEES